MKYIELTYQLDKRYKEGRRLVGRREVSEETYLYSKAIQEANPGGKYSLEWHPATKIVTNLMTGKDIEIDYDTPRSCDPSSELYWSM
jgi:hypothetical protein